MAAGGGKKTKNLVIAGAVVVFALWRLGAPFLEETDDMKKELEKIKQEISQIRTEAAQYDKAWETKMTSIDTRVKALLPDDLNSSDVLDYFLAQFEKLNTGHIWFLSVTQAGIMTVNFNSGRNAAGGNPRAAKYRFEAQLHQAKMVPYIEHIEKYAGLFRLSDFTFYVTKEIPDSLKMEMNLEFYLSPKEWIKADSIADKDDEDDDGEDNQPAPWRQVFLSTPAETKAAVATRKLASHIRRAGAGKLPVFDRMVGDSVIADETLYEEGDTVGGWKIMQIDPKTKSVRLQSGDVTKTIMVAK